MLKLSLYDFDKTIYNGDTGFDLLLYILKNIPKTQKFIPIIIWNSLLFGLKIISTEKYKENIYRFLSILPKENWEKIINKFWLHHRKNIFPLVLKQIKEDKNQGYMIGIVSASPDFFLEPIVKGLSADFLIGTRFHSTYNTINSKIIGKNCKKEEKVSRLFNFMEEHYPNQEYIIDKMYSDSLHDLPLFNIAQKKFTIESDGSIRKGIPNKNNNL